MDLRGRVGTRRRQSPALLGAPRSIGEASQAAGGERGDAAPKTPAQRNKSAGGGREGGRTLTYWLGVWKKRQEQRNWQHMGSRWYRSSSRMRIATMKTEVDTAARGREKRRMSRWSPLLLPPLHPPGPSAKSSLEKPQRSQVHPLPVPRTPKARLCPTSLSPYETRNHPHNQRGSAPSRTQSNPRAPPAGTSPRGDRAPGTPLPSRPGPGLSAHTRHLGRVPVRRRSGLPGTRGSHPAHAPLRGAHPVPPTAPAAPLRPGPPAPGASGTAEKDQGPPSRREWSRRHSLRPLREATAETDPARRRRRPPPPGPAPRPHRSPRPPLTRGDDDGQDVTVHGRTGGRRVRRGLAGVRHPAAAAARQRQPLPAARAPSAGGAGPGGAEPGREGRSRTHSAAAAVPGAAPPRRLPIGRRAALPPRPIGRRRDRLHSADGGRCCRRLPWRRGAAGLDPGQRSPGPAGSRSLPSGDERPPVDHRPGPAQLVRGYLSPRRHRAGVTGAGSRGQAGRRCPAPHGAARARVSGQGTAPARSRSWGGRAGLGCGRLPALTLCSSPAGSRRCPFIS